MGFATILWQESIIFRKKFWSITAGAMVGPILYLVAFGWGLGNGMTVGGASYIHFVIPGIIALSTMSVSFSNIGNSINISRMYDKTFEEYMIAPINMRVYAFGKVTAGALRGLYSAALLLVLAWIFRTGIRIGPYFLTIILMNCLVFSALGFTAGIVIDSHTDMNKFNNFIITPMSFLCGTFFPLDKMPAVVKEIIGLLPLTHTSLALRAAGEDLTGRLVHFGVLLLYFTVLMAVGVRLCKKAE